MILKIGSTDDLPKAAAAILESLDGRSVVAFRGEMGAGKTTLIRAICDALGVTDTVTSPTFAIANEYHTDRADVAHFDLYRILDSEALFEIGFDEYLDGSKIVLIEWSENAADILPGSYKTVHIQYGNSENDRVVTIGEVKEQ